MVTAYCDADWAGDIDSRKSTTGYIIKLNECVVSWVCKKQTSVALSTAEAEYMAISAAVQEVKWFTQLLSELDYAQVETPVIVFTDNQAALQIGENDVNHSREKHIDIKHHHIRDAIKKDEIKLHWIPTGEQIADINTKGLSRNLFLVLREQLMSK